MSKIQDLKFDNKNFNKHNKDGMALLEKSLQELGAGRSILIDKDNNIIAGNGIVEAAGQAGLDKVKIIETDGTEIMAVKRTDMELNSKKGREMALADNATANANLEWDFDNVLDVFSLRAKEVFAKTRDIWVKYQAKITELCNRQEWQFNKSFKRQKRLYIQRLRDTIQNTRISIKGLFRAGYCLYRGEVMKVKLPAYIEVLDDGPHKRDLIRHFKKGLRNEN